MEINGFQFFSSPLLWIVPNAAVRSGDYYLFEDLDEKVELDLLHERPSAGIEDAITDRKMGDKMTVEEVNFSSDNFLFPFNIRSLKIHRKEIIFFCYQTPRKETKIKSLSQIQNQCTKKEKHNFFYLQFVILRFSIIFVFVQCIKELI